MERSEQPDIEDIKNKFRGSDSPFTASDLVVDDEGRIYHLQVKPEEIAPDILIVGDPGRAEFIGSTFLIDIEVEHEHRGLVTITGTSGITGKQATIISPVRTTVTTSGIGTSSLEIVVAELVALNEIDFETRMPKTDFPRLHIIRVGSSGGLQALTRLGTSIITTYAIGLDNAGVYFEGPYQDENCKRLEKEFDQKIKDSMSIKSRFYNKIHPYVSRAEPNIVKGLLEAAEILGVQAKLGLTTSSPGFFAAEGRDIYRVKPSVPDLDKIFSAYDPKVDGQLVENMEMESSFLFHFLGCLGHWAGTICPTIANRQENTFDIHYQESMKNTIEVALLALAILRSRNPDIYLEK